jgi:hypothetical protein
VLMIRCARVYRCVSAARVSVALAVATGHLTGAVAHRGPMEAGESATGPGRQARAGYGIAGSAGICSSGVVAGGASAGAALNEVAHGFRSRWMTRAMFWMVVTP